MSTLVALNILKLLNKEKNFMKIPTVAQYLKTFLSLNIPTDTKKEVDGYNWAKSSGCSAEALQNYVELSAEVGRKNQFDFGIERYLREIL